MPAKRKWNGKTALILVVCFLVFRAVSLPLLAGPLEFNIKYNAAAEGNIYIAPEPAPHISLIFNGKVEIINQDSAGNRLEGTRFRLLDSQGNTVQENIITSRQGRATITGLAEGDYQLIEVEVPAGYHLDNRPHNISIVYDVNGPTINLEIENVPVEMPPPENPADPQQLVNIATTGDNTRFTLWLLVVLIALGSLLYSVWKPARANLQQ